jgi:multidrug efflux pump
VTKEEGLLRPVLMTSAATVFGHLPLVFVSGPGAAARDSIGTVLVAGMHVGTLFPLFIVPVYLAMGPPWHVAAGAFAGIAIAWAVPGARRRA